MPWLMISGWGMSTDALGALARPGDRLATWDQASAPTAPSWVMGWSLGGVVAAGLIDHPNVLGVVTLCTPVHFQSQVDSRFFKRLSRSVERDAPAALAGFADWLLPDAPVEWRRTQSLSQGLERLWDSDLRGVSGLHRLVAQSDPLFHSDDANAIPGDHQLPYTQPALIREHLDRIAHAV